jgi:kynurenine formamidase
MIETVKRMERLTNLDGNLPSYKDLPLIETLRMRTCWGLFGDEDELGCMNLLTPTRVASACALVQAGERVALSLPLEAPSPAHGKRKQYVHHRIENRNSRDDYLDQFYLQASSQWDGLRHIRAREFGWYNGFREDAIDTDGPERKLGIEKLAERGVFSRGVLADVRRVREAEGRQASALVGEFISTDELRHVLDVQGTTLIPGDMLLVRTGWLEDFDELSGDDRDAAMHSRNWLGLDTGEDMAEFLWDNHVVSVCADNVAVEFGPGDSTKGFLHRRILALLGIWIGEFWALGELSEACARHSRNEFLCASVPLRVAGGVGSPANAVALF